MPASRPRWRNHPLLSADCTRATAHALPYRSQKHTLGTATVSPPVGCFWVLVALGLEQPYLPTLRPPPSSSSRAHAHAHLERCEEDTNARNEPPQPRAFGVLSVLRNPPLHLQHDLWRIYLVRAILAQHTYCRCDRCLSYGARVLAGRLVKSGEGGPTPAASVAAAAYSRAEGSARSHRHGCASLPCRLPFHASRQPRTPPARIVRAAQPRRHSFRPPVRLCKPFRPPPVLRVLSEPASPAAPPAGPPRPSHASSLQGPRSPPRTCASRAFAA